MSEQWVLGFLASTPLVVASFWLGWLWRDLREKKAELARLQGDIAFFAARLGSSAATKETP